MTEIVEAEFLNQRGRTLRIPPFLSLALKCQDAAVRVEILRDNREKRKQKVEAESGQCCHDDDAELMRAEIAYREIMLSYEAELRKTLGELRRTKIPVMSRVNGVGSFSLKANESVLTETIETVQLAVDRFSHPVSDHGQELADRCGEPVLVVNQRTDASKFSREYQALVPESKASVNDRANVVRRITPSREVYVDTQR